MTSLSHQLARLQQRPEHDSKLSKSFLFSNQDAKQISREQVHELAMAGLRTLLVIDNRFASFIEPLFAQSFIRRERVMLNSTESAEISAQFAKLGVLLSPHLFLTAAQQVVEYLVRVFEVHTYDVATILAMFLPYHDHAIFGRMLMLLDLRGSGFDFLEKNQLHGNVLPRASLVVAAVENGNVMRLIADSAQEAANMGVSNNAVFALFAGVASAAAVHKENEAVFRILLPYLVRMIEEMSPIASPTAMLILCTWCTEASLTTRTLAAVVKPIIAALSTPSYPVPTSDILSVLGHICKTQLVAVRDVAFGPVLSLMLGLPWTSWWGTKLISPCTHALLHRLLDFSLVTLSQVGVTLGATSDTIQFIIAACESMEKLSSKDVAVIFHLIVQHCVERSGDDEVSIMLVGALKMLERRFTQYFDDSVSNALKEAAKRADATAATSPLKKTKKSAHNVNEGAAQHSQHTFTAPYDVLVEFICTNFVGTKYEMLDVPAEHSMIGDVQCRKATGAAKLPLLSCLVHHVPEIRALAFRLLHSRVKEGDISSVVLVELIGDAEGSTSSMLLPFLCHSMELEPDVEVALEALRLLRAVITISANRPTTRRAILAIEQMLASAWIMVASGVNAPVVAVSTSSSRGSAVTLNESVPSQLFASICVQIVNYTKEASIINNSITPTKKAVGGKKNPGLVATEEEAVMLPVQVDDTDVLCSSATYYMFCLANVEAGMLTISSSNAATIDCPLQEALNLVTPAYTSMTTIASASPNKVASQSPSQKHTLKKKSADITDSSDDEDFVETLTTPKPAPFVQNALFTRPALFRTIRGIISHCIFDDTATIYGAGTSTQRHIGKSLLHRLRLSRSMHSGGVVHDETVEQSAHNMHLTAEAELAVIVSTLVVAACTLGSSLNDRFHRHVMTKLHSFLLRVPVATGGTLRDTVAAAVQSGLDQALLMLHEDLLTVSLASDKQKVAIKQAYYNIASVIRLLVLVFNYPLPHFSACPAPAFWALTATDASGVITVPSHVVMSLIPAWRQVDAPNMNKTLTDAEENELLERATVTLFKAVQYCCYEARTIAAGASASFFSPEATAFVLLLPTFAPTPKMRQNAVEALQQAVLGAGGTTPSRPMPKKVVAKNKGNDSVSPLAAILSYLTVGPVPSLSGASTTALSVTSMSSLVEVMALVTANSLLTEDMGKLILTLLVVLSGQSGCSNDNNDDASLGQSVGSLVIKALPTSMLTLRCVASCLKAVFAHNKRSIAKHGEAILAAFLPWLERTCSLGSDYFVSGEEGELLKVLSSLIAFPAGPATLAATTILLKKGAVLIQSRDSEDITGKTRAALAARDVDINICSVYPAVLAALSSYSPKSTAVDAPHNRNTVLDPHYLLQHLLLPLYEKGTSARAAATEVGSVNTTADAQIVMFLTTTTYGFSTVLSVTVLEMLQEIAVSLQPYKNDERHLGKKSDRISLRAKTDKTKVDTCTLLELLSDVIASLSSVSSGIATAVPQALRAIFVTKLFTTCCSILKSNHDAATTIYEHSDISESATTDATQQSCVKTMWPLTSRSVVALLHLIRILVSAVPTCVGSIVVATHVTIKGTKHTVANEAAIENDIRLLRDVADDDVGSTEGAISALHYIVRHFDLTVLDSYLTGQRHVDSVNDDDDENNATSAANVRYSTVSGSTIAAAANAVIPLAALELVQTLINTVRQNTNALQGYFAGKSEGRVIICECSGLLLRRALLLIVSLFSLESARFDAKRLMPLVGQLLHAVAPILSNGSDVMTAPKPTEGITAIGGVSSLLHIPLMALYLKLDANAALFASTVLLFDSPIDIVLRILGSFPLEDQMDVLCGLMNLVKDPAGHIETLAALESSSSSNTSIAALCGRLIKAGKVINRQEPILNLIALAIKSEAFLTPFIAMQHSEDIVNLKGPRMRRGDKKEEDDAVVTEKGGEFAKTNTEGSTRCAQLLVAALSMFSHYHELNIATPMLGGDATRIAGDDDVEETDIDADGDVMPDENKAYTMLLELLSGNCLACILAAINEPTFVECQIRLLSDARESLQCKGLETLLDRLHQSLPTVEYTRTVEEEDQYAKDIRDPKKRLHAADLVAFKAKPLTTRRSAAMLPLLLTITQQECSRVGTTSTAASMRKLHTAISCVEELVRIIGAGGSTKAAVKLLSNENEDVSRVAAAESAAGMSGVLTEAILGRLFFNKGQVNSVHSFVATIVTMHSKVLTRLNEGKISNKSKNGAENTNSIYVLVAGAITALATIVRTLGSIFSAPHANDILAAFADWMNFIMGVRATAASTKFNDNTAACALLRHSLLTSLTVALPSLWIMTHPYVPTYIAFACYKSNTSDGDTVGLSTSLLVLLKGLLGPRTILECVTKAMMATDNSTQCSPITPATHNMRVIFILIDKMLAEMTKDLVEGIAMLVTPGDNNFWQAALVALARGGTTSSSSSIGLTPFDVMEPVFAAYTTFFLKFKEKKCLILLSRIVEWAFGAAAMHSDNKDQVNDKNKTAKSRRVELSSGTQRPVHTHEDDATEDDGGYNTIQLHRQVVFLGLYTHLLQRVGPILLFTFSLVANPITEMLDRYNVSPFTIIAQSAGGSDGGAWLLRRKALQPKVTVALTALLRVIQLMSVASQPDAATSVSGLAQETFFAKTETFHAIMPLLVAQMSNTVIIQGNDVDVSDIIDDGVISGYFARAERTVVPALRAYFAALNSPKLWSLTQKELIKLLRHPKADVRRATLLTLQLIYRDGGDSLAAMIMAEGLPAIVEMTEDTNRMVKEAAKQLCIELSTITGQDVLHAMS